MNQKKSKQLPATLKFKTQADLTFGTGRNKGDVCLSFWAGSTGTIEARFSFEEIFQTTLALKEEEAREDAKDRIIKRFKDFLTKLEENKDLQTKERVVTKTAQ